MFIDSEDDENSISTGCFFFVFLKKYMVHCNQHSKNPRVPGTLSCIAVM